MQQSSGEMIRSCQKTLDIFTSPCWLYRAFCIHAKKDSILLMKSGILRGRKSRNSQVSCLKRNTDDVATCNRQHHPPVCQELACRSISFILPQNRLKITLMSNSCKESKGVGLCLPQSYPNSVLCCNRAVQQHPLVFCFLGLLSPCKTFLTEVGVSDVTRRLSRAGMPDFLSIIASIGEVRTWRKS